MDDTNGFGPETSTLKHVRWVWQGCGYLLVKVCGADLIVFRQLSVEVHWTPRLQGVPEGPGEAVYIPRLARHFIEFRKTGGFIYESRTLTRDT